MQQLLLLALLSGAAADVVRIPLASTDGHGGSVKLSTWEALIDPVMGGVSTGEWTVNDDGSGSLVGEVKDVPSLSAPGFVTAGAVGAYPDASAAIDGGIELTVRSTTAAYAGWRVSFAAGTASPGYACAGGGGIPFSRGCYKADWAFPAAAAAAPDDWQVITVPFAAFSDLWSSATGVHTANCTAADPRKVCPTADGLKGISYVEVWAEGVDGSIQLDVKSVAAVAAATAAPAAPQPVASLDVAAYAGRWYQAYASLSVIGTFEIGGDCVTADYAAASTAGHITVANTVRIGGTLPIPIHGFAAQQPDHPGSFDVVLGPDASEKPFGSANYWIIGLGPKNGTQYDWATVSDPDQDSLYVLVRDVAYFEQAYEKDVLATLDQQGFTSRLNKPIKTRQDGCDYGATAAL